MVMTVSDTANYPVATRFPVPPPAVQQEADVAKHRFYNGLEGPGACAGSDPSSCLQESNVNHPTELPTRRGASCHGPEDRDLMPPPVAPVSVSMVSNIKEREKTDSENLEPERKKLKGALGGIASIYGSDDSDDNEEDTPPSPTAKRKIY